MCRHCEYDYYESIRITRFMLIIFMTFSMKVVGKTSTNTATSCLAKGQVIGTALIVCLFKMTDFLQECFFLTLRFEYLLIFQAYSLWQESNSLLRVYKVSCVFM